MPTMIVLVNLKEDVAPEEYEIWLQERYVPAILDLASVDEWRGYRVGSLSGNPALQEETARTALVSGPLPEGLDLGVSGRKIAGRPRPGIYAGGESEAAKTMIAGNSTR